MTAEDIVILKLFKEKCKEKDVSRNLISRPSCHGSERAGAAKYSSPVGFSLIVIVEAHSCDE